MTDSMYLFRLLQMSNPALAREVAKSPKKMQAIQEMEADHIAVAAGSIIEDMIPGVKLRLRKDDDRGSGQ